jgi:GNAT superfamily N-acetyltransferase
MERNRDMGIRRPTPEDVPAMAALADLKRQQYRDNSSPFQRPALDAVTVQEAFLAKLIEWDGFLVRVHDGRDRVDGFVVARVGSAPPPFGEGNLFHVDDFMVATPALWETVGAALLERVAAEAASAGAERAIVVSGSRIVDAPKVDFLAGLGLECEAEWWVKPVEPNELEPVEMRGFDAFVGPAPPVYDPGGLTCLATKIESPAALRQFEEFASASQAVVAIVPTLTSRLDLRAALGERGYTVASEWYAGRLLG